MEGRSRSFEIIVNDKLIFSKLSNGRFPDLEKVVEEIIKASKGLEMDEVKETDSGCIIC